MQPLRRQIMNWKAVLLGSSGNFRIGSGLSVEFIQSSLDSALLSKVDPVRRIFRRDELRFDMLLQRDLDDIRIDQDLIPYLGESHRLRFFPAITIVIIPRPTKKPHGVAELPNNYPAMNQKIDVDERGYSQWIRSFGDLFEVARFISDPKISVINDVTEGCLYPEAELRLTDDACLLAIDGQHRLIALQGVMDKLPGDERVRYPSLGSIDHSNYDSLKVPATIMYIPCLHAGNNENSLTLAEAFRQVFVDINRNARQVNESRNILLDEHDLNSIFTRTICSFVQENGHDANHINLDCIEWDKVDQENQLTRPASMTNVVFIKSVFQSWLGDGTAGDDGGRLRTNLQLDLLQTALECTDVPYGNLTVTNFTYNQKKVIIQHFDQDYLRAVVNLLSSFPGALMRQVIVEEIRKYLSNPEGDPEDILARQKVLEVMFGGPEHAMNLRERKVNALYGLQVAKLRTFDDTHGINIVRTKMFQKAFFRCIFELYAAGYVKRMEFNEFSKMLVDRIHGDFQTSWFKLFGKDKPALDRYGLERYGVAEWKVQIVFCIVFLILVKCNVEFIADPGSCNLKRQEYAAHLWGTYQVRIKQLVQEDKIRGSETKKITCQGMEEIKQIAGKDISFT